MCLPDEENKWLRWGNVAGMPTGRTRAWQELPFTHCTLAIGMLLLRWSLCTKFCHVCAFAEDGDETACRACQRRCHSSFESELCEFHGSCTECAKHMLYVAPNSELCREAQLEIGCHLCGRENCYQSSEQCFAKCTSARHVCTHSKEARSNCHACGHACHKRALDSRCKFFGLA